MFSGTSRGKKYEPPPLAREGERDGAADAAPADGNERDFVGEKHE
jgi:hypothetical protein